MEKRNNILKDRSKISINYIEKLGNFLLENQQIYFSGDNQADSWSDMCTFPNKKSDREHICMPGEPMLIDRNYKGVHTYCICTISENRKITSEIPVIEVSKLSSSFWRNGYFLLPIL